ncbi:MAG: imidazole glycerol phosphate synthase subunit HisH [Candidatus Aminicenantes bacterium]|nr:imidazole glycerol phosphate synthase subunit HisH [Candidatus Aminicenantes bacterium]
MKIGIVDYGAGNLRSVRNAFDYLGMKSLIVDSPSQLKELDKLVLPGVGAFGHAVGRMRDAGFFSPVYDWLKEDRPFLGICLGFQMLFDLSDESPDEKGFGFFEGSCRRFRERKVPQIGWNAVQTGGNTLLFDGIPSGEHFYFVHSYYVAAGDGGMVLGRTEYGLSYVSVVGNGHVFGVQFHPEKSGEAGLTLLENWGKKC